MRLSHLTDIQRYGSAENLLGRLALCTFEAGITNQGIDSVAAQRFPNSEGVAALTKAAQNPAMTTTPGYAQELVRVTYGELQDLVRSAAILPAAVPPEQSLSFNGASSIYLPVRTGAEIAPAAFRAEGAPISVKGLMFQHQLLKPKSMGVILTASGEMLHRSSVDLAAYFQSAIRKDTARALDAHFIGDSAASAIAPAGARNGLTAADTRASTGATAAAIVTDIKAMLAGLSSSDMGSPATKWLMHPKNWYALSMLQSATGALQFPEAAMGQIEGIPVVQSTTMPTDIVLLIDFSAFAFALGNPAFTPTQVAEIHEEDTTPLPIGSPGTPATVAAPTRSLYQSYCFAVRAVFDVDWLKLVAVGPVQQLTAVAWG